MTAVPCPPLEGDGAGPRIIVADDNADMRQCLVRILSERYGIESVPDGEAALAAARRRLPDLILSDIVMPGLDGFELLREVRADESLRHVPVILLSARAEALNNISKHSQVSRVKVALSGAEDWMRLEVSDNGEGFEPENHLHRSASGGFGLASMKERTGLS